MIIRSARSRYGWLALGLAAMVVLAYGRGWAGEAVSGERLDLVQVLRLANGQSRTAVVAAADQEAAAAAIRKAQAGWWPSVTARELIWDGGKRSLAVAAARRQEEAVRASGEADIQQAQLAALDTYLGTLELTGSGKVLDQRLEALNAHLDVVHDLYGQGLTTRNDLLETQVRVREVEDAVQAVDHRRATTLQDLNRQLGREPETPAALPDSLPAAPPLPGNRDELLTAASLDNAALRAAASRLAAGRTFASLARRAWTPNLFVSAMHFWQENETLVYPHVNAVMAGVSWDIFDGGARGADVQEAAAQVAAAARDRLEVERAVTVALDGAWRAWDQARREERTAHANVAATLENLRIVEDQYRQGLARSSDVLDAEALLATSRFDAVTKHYATYRAQARLLVAAGRDLAGFYAAGRTAAGEQ
jgi:outer membrane protein